MGKQTWRNETARDTINRTFELLQLLLRREDSGFLNGVRNW